MQNTPHLQSPIPLPTSPTEPNRSKRGAVGATSASRVGALLRSDRTGGFGGLEDRGSGDDRPGG